MAPGAPASSATPFLPEGLLLDLLAVSLTGVNVLRPRYGPAGQLTDFFFAYINPAAQRITGQPQQPAETLCTLYPNSVLNGIFDFYRRVFETGEAGLYQVNYQADGLNNYFHVAARRSGEFLLASFTNTSDQDRSPVEEALRQSQAREQAARAAAEARQAELTRLFEQSPVAIAVLRGPAYVIELANAEMGRIWGRPAAQTVGRPIFEALPDTLDQGFEPLFADVLQHGTPYELQEVAVTHDRGHTGRPLLGYFNLTYRPQYAADGSITGILIMATEVTDQVLARQQLEQLNTEELTLLNAEMMG
jgi:PAS domain-containing protein